LTKIPEKDERSSQFLHADSEFPFDSLFLRSLFVDWCGNQIGGHWGMMTGMLAGNLVGIGVFDSWRKLKGHPDFGPNKA
jgi:hypothetical protein